MRKIVTIVLICVLVAVACVSGYKIFQIMSEYQTGENTYGDLRRYVTYSTWSKRDSKKSKEPNTAKTSIDFEGLSAINSDIVGWIKLDGSVIDYPVVKCDNNDYYLEHLFDKQVNSSGCIFLDCRNSSDFFSRNSVIYGHHMKNGSMFSAITNYKNQSFYDEHPLFQLYTPNANYEVEIFAGYVADLQDNAWNTDFVNDDDFLKWLDERFQKSVFQSDVRPAADDKIVTLSTCSYDFDNARFVVFGVIH